ncbi:High mobility group 20A [Paramuricea clavata]|uniref:High mobility group 20A n=1 Tax=Paramuricea clavata TaxID=317549 RepID=A0A7D9E6B9_PARCT|nr:High mobility group 20A [Paramuricea clavata]
MDNPPMEIDLVDEKQLSTAAPGTITNTTTNIVADPAIGADTHSGTGINSPPKPTSTTTTSSPTTKTNLMTSGKRKQKLLWRDENAPKPPLSAYLQFLSKNRDAVRSQNPGVAVNELTKVLGTMWSEMPLDKKQSYLDQAERDKKQYMTELEQYQKTDSYKSFVQEREKTLKVLKQEEKASPGSHLICIPCNKWFENAHNFREHVKSRKHQRNILEAQTRGKKSKKSTLTVRQDDHTVETVAQRKAPTQGIPASKSATQVNNFPDMSAVSEGDLNVPVFSDAFLHYNKSRESELRKLRKATTELEEQNAILSKHIDNLNTAIGKLEDEKTESAQDIETLEPFLKSFHEFVSRHFCKSGLSDADTQLTELNIREFLLKLHKIYSSSDNTTIAKLKKVLNELDYPNCLDNKQ